jgi:hypothetical protein
MVALRIVHTCWSLMIRSRILAALVACLLPAFAQHRASDTWLPGETNGLDRIIEALITAFDHADVLGLGEAGGLRRWLSKGG